VREMVRKLVAKHADVKADPRQPPSPSRA
jgi:hypothetical protein